MLSKTIQPKDYTKTNMLMISNLPEGCTPEQLWQLFSILCGPAFIAVKQNNTESCLAVFVNPPQARLAQKALEFIIFKNHILSSKGFDYTQVDLILPPFFQIGLQKPQLIENVNLITTPKNGTMSPAQISYISKLRKCRHKKVVKEKYGSDDEYNQMLM